MISEVARDLRVTEGSVRRWHRVWQDGGAEALRSKGPVSREKLSPQQWARRELELRKRPLEAVWSLLKRSMANFAAADLAGLVRIVKPKLKKIQYRPHLIDGCVAATGLRIGPSDNPLILTYLSITYSVCPG